MAPDRSELAVRIRAVTDLLERLAGDWGVLDDLSAEDRRRFHLAVAAMHNPDPVARRKRVKAVERARKADAARREDGVLHETGIRSLRRQPVFTTPNVFPPESFLPEDVSPSNEGEVRSLEGAAPAIGPSPDLRNCYVCKQKYTEIHHFYDQLCPSCADVNYRKRTELADLRGRVALVTGGRVKIGYQACLKLLRSGAHVLVTTRFPRNAAARYAAESDFAVWRGRLDIFGLDLRHAPSVEALCRDLLATRPRLDFIVNNACQTVRRPPEFYAHMMAEERGLDPSAPAQRLLVRAEWAGDAAASAELSQLALLPEELAPQRDLFPEGRLDQDLQQVDLRGRNSWRLLLAEVSSVELIEVQLVNAIAPFILNARLKPLLARTPERDKHIVNVSAMEGQFYRRFKTTRHPHTNMAKAALNMMTRTSATDYFQDGIHMNSVDTGWVTDEDPEAIAARKTVEQRFHPPLDAIDGAARILDPIIDGFNTGTHVWGKFLKDYAPTDW